MSEQKRVPYKLKLAMTVAGVLGSLTPLAAFVVDIYREVGNVRTAGQAGYEVLAPAIREALKELDEMREDHQQCEKVLAEYGMFYGDEVISGTGMGGPSVPEIEEAEEGFIEEAAEEILPRARNFVRMTRQSAGYNIPESLDGAVEQKQLKMKAAR